MWDDIAISRDTKQMLSKLLEHHQVKQVYLLKARVVAICLGLLLLSFGLYLYSQILLPANQSFERIFILLLEDSFAFFLVVGNIVLYSMTLFYVSKYKSTKQKLDKLRVEAIDRLNSSWVDSHKARLKDLISARLQKNGVNLSHKEK
ncbi:DUF2663 family protein [Bacillus horti]|uniref:DUF2663 family protein n=1 Tax=Caldalkalibacillus horti TaxID=77523 RepID=A0ABT9W373_9BACI|nr:DUF2663 family protein [Bacillus horti]MDQ0167522.1 hypothetical protein [Bacillus horti]